MRKGPLRHLDKLFLLEAQFFSQFAEYRQRIFDHLAIEAISNAEVARFSK